MGTTLINAIHQARLVRRQLLRTRTGASTDLFNHCGLASLMLAARLGSARSLRAVEREFGTHVWNVVEGVNVDITATQFNRQDPQLDFRGVLVSRDTHFFHEAHRLGAGVLVGREVVAFMKTNNWYEGAKSRRVAALCTRLAPRAS